jgi:hypothetical protein
LVLAFASTGCLGLNVLKGRLLPLKFVITYFALLFVALASLSASAAQPTVRRYASAREAFKGPDHTITWRAWQQNREFSYRFRTGDRYMGGQVWEHYLGFEEYRSANTLIKLSMICLGNECLPERVVIGPGLRYAIVKVTNGTMTAHKGMWTWDAHEVQQSPGSPSSLWKEP